MGMVFSMVQFPSDKLQEYIDNPENFEKDLMTLVENQANPSLYLDKSWEAIHYILTGTKIGSGVKPLSLVIYSEQFFDEEQNLGMGPASYLTAEQVKEIDYILEKLDDTFLKEKYKPLEMVKFGVYPNFWDKDPTLFDYVADNFQKLKDFYKDAASKSHAIASYMN
jgi:hypothetical protein